jgi:hypothetical protein
MITSRKSGSTKWKSRLATSIYEFEKNEPYVRLFVCKSTLFICSFAELLRLSVRSLAKPLRLSVRSFAKLLCEEQWKAHLSWKRQTSELAYNGTLEMLHSQFLFGLRITTYWSFIIFWLKFNLVGKTSI